MTPIDYVIGVIALLAATLVDVTARFLGGIRADLAAHAEADLTVASEFRQEMREMRAELLDAIRGR